MTRKGGGFRHPLPGYFGFQRLVRATAASEPVAVTHFGEDLTLKAIQTGSQDRDFTTIQTAAHAELSLQIVDLEKIGAQRTHFAAVQTA